MSTVQIYRHRVFAKNNSFGDLWGIQVFVLYIIVTYLTVCHNKCYNKVQGPPRQLLTTNTATTSMVTTNISHSTTQPQALIRYTQLSVSASIGHKNWMRHAYMQHIYSDKLQCILCWPFTFLQAAAIIRSSMQCWKTPFCKFSSDCNST